MTNVIQRMNSALDVSCETFSIHRCLAGYLRETHARAPARPLLPIRETTNELFPYFFDYRCLREGKLCLQNIHTEPSYVIFVFPLRGVHFPKPSISAERKSPFRTYGCGEEVHQEKSSVVHTTTLTKSKLDSDSKFFL